jgi:hypothetical protein
MYKQQTMRDLGDRRMSVRKSDGGPNEEKDIARVAEG